MIKILNESDQENCLPVFRNRSMTILIGIRFDTVDKKMFYWFRQSLVTGQVSKPAVVLLFTLSKLILISIITLDDCVISLRK